MKEVSTQEKAAWIIGIALIVFLIILGGCLIGLQITRDKINNVANNPNLNGGAMGTTENYTVWEDGTKENVNPKVTDAQIEIDGIEFSSFSIREKQDENPSGEGIVRSEIRMNLQNLSDEDKDSQTYLVKLYNDAEQIIFEFSVQVADLKAGQSTKILHTTYGLPCVNAERVEVENVSSNHVEDNSSSTND